MHGTSRLSSAISNCDIYQSFTTILPSEVVARLVGCWTIDLGVVRQEFESTGRISTHLPKNLLRLSFYFSFLPGLVDFAIEHLKLRCF